MRITVFCIGLITFLSLVMTAYPNEKQIFFHEDFKGISNWKPFYFSKKKKNTQYTIVQDGDTTYLKAESNASASALILNREFNVREYSGLRWKWKVENVYQKGDVREKAGDDYPLRIYVVFKYDPERASFRQKMKYGLAKKIYGEYPPHSGLTYIWANNRNEKGIITNPFAAEVKMVILEAGPDRTGQWIEEDVNIVQDYRKAFGTDPPDTAVIAIMNDSDNTGERSVSYIEYIEVYKMTRSAE